MTKEDELAEALRTAVMKLARCHDCRWHDFLVANPFSHSHTPCPTCLFNPSHADQWESCTR